MSPVVSVVTTKEPEHVFIPIEDVPVVLSELRRSLPQLREELSRKWPVDSVQLEERRPRLKNPFEPSQVIPAACIGLVVIFSSAVLKAAGTKIGEGIGDGIKPFVTRWVKGHFAKSSKGRIASNTKKKQRTSRLS
ncbi:MAG: hypothetical protein WAQ77_04070 [Candidatus Acidiferrum sp.]